MCYDRRMIEVASRELRNRTRALLDLVATGERVVITVDGRPAAVLGPIDARPRWMRKEEFVARVLAHQADAGLTADLRELLGGEMTDESEI